MQLRVRHFAALRKAAGVELETVALDGGDLRALYRQLQQRHGWSFAESAVRVAVNDAQLNEIADYLMSLNPAVAAPTVPAPVSTPAPAPATQPK